MTQAQIRELLPKARLLLRDRTSIKAYQLMHLLELEDTRQHRQMCGRILAHLPEWKKSAANAKYDRVDIRTTSYRLVISLSDEQKSFLDLQKQKFGLSYASSIRSLITQRIETVMTGSSFTSREVSPIGDNQRAFCKVPDAQNIASLNQELKALFARLPCQEQKDT